MSDQSDLSRFGIDTSNNEGDADANAALLAEYERREAKSTGGPGAEGEVDPGADPGEEPPSTPEPAVDAVTADVDQQGGTQSGTPSPPPAAPGDRGEGATTDGDDGKVHDQSHGTQAGEGGGGGDGGDDGARPAGPDADAGTAPPPPTPEPEVVRWQDQEFDSERMQRMVQLDQWASTLTPEATQAVNAVLVEGTHVVVDRETAQRWVQYEQERAGGAAAPTPQTPQAPPTPQYQQPGQVQQPTTPQNPYAVQAPPPPPPDPLAGLDLDDLDPSVVAAIRAQQAQLQQLQQTVQQSQGYVEQQAQAQLQREREQAFQQVDAGRDQFAAEYGIPAPQAEQLLVRMGEMQILPQYLAKHNGDITAATKEAMEAVGWMDPTIRPNLAAKSNLVPQGDAAAAEKRRTKAASLGGGGGSAERPGFNGGQQQEQQTATGPGRTAAMAQAIREAQNNGQPQ